MTNIISGSKAKEIILDLVIVIGVALMVFTALDIRSRVTVPGCSTDMECAMVYGGDGGPGR